METLYVDQMRYLSSNLNLEKVESYGTESVRVEANHYKSSLENGRIAQMIESISKPEILGLISDGNYGKLYKGKLNNCNITIQPLNVVQFKTDEIKKRREFLALLQHESIVKLLATYLDFNNLAAVFILQDIKTTLRLFYQDFVPKRVTARLMIQLVEAIKYIHDHNIILVDINPENILVTSEDNLVVSHFGQAHRINMNEIFQPVRQIAGLPEYMDKDALDFKYSKSTDIFSVACVLFEIWNNNAYIACPNECIALPPQEFYKQVLDRGRPFFRKNPLTHQFELYENNGKQRENLVIRLQNNLKLSCPDENFHDFCEIFSGMLNEDSGLRPGADAILNSKAFHTLRRLRTLEFHPPTLRIELCSETFIGTSCNHDEILRAKVRFLALFGFSQIYFDGICPFMPKIKTTQATLPNDRVSSNSKSKELAAAAFQISNLQSELIPQVSPVAFTQMLPPSNRTVTVDEQYQREDFSALVYDVLESGGSTLLDNIWVESYERGNQTTSDDA